MADLRLLMTALTESFSAGSAIAASFLSQLDCDSYYGSEERFTGELTAYTRKQFFEVHE